MKLKPNAFADLQRRADSRDELLRSLEDAVSARVTEYRRAPSPERHDAIARAVKSLRTAQAGRA